jgi:hypothetical protein
MRSKFGGLRQTVLYIYLPKSDRVLVRRLKKGEKIRGHVSRHREDSLGGILPRVPDSLAVSLGLAHRRELSDEDILRITWGNLEGGFVKASAVNVTCVPRDDDFMRQYSPDLPELPWEPKESG